MEIWKTLVTNFQFCGAKDVKKNKHKKIPKGLFLESLEDRTTPTSTAQLLKFAPEETTLLGPRPTTNIDYRPSIVFLDQDLLGRVPQEELNSSTVISINHQSDPLEQMTEALSGMSNIEVVRIISHGRDGALVFGESVIDDYQLQTHEKELNDWAKALAPDADILIYGCNFAETEIGKKITQKIALWTGADICANTSKTGYGGDTTLDFIIGNIDSFLNANLESWIFNNTSLEVSQKQKNGAGTFWMGSGSSWKNMYAFAALGGDGSISAWGDPNFGGTGAPIGQGFTELFSNEAAFAAIKEDGTLAAWGTISKGGSGAPSGNSYTKVFSTQFAFAALKSDGSISTWGDPVYGSTGAPTDFGYKTIFSTASAFAALKPDGSITTWGNTENGGIGSPIGSGYIQIANTSGSFAALKSDGSLTSWGNSFFGGTGAPSGQGFTKIFSSGFAFSALKNDGSIISWGNPQFGGTGSPISNNFLEIYSSLRAFAAKKNDGSIAVWGNITSGGITPPNGTNFIQVASNATAFAALRGDGSIATFGDASYGGTGGPTQSGFIKIYSTEAGFAALKSDGTITAWGNPNTATVNVPKDGGYIQIFSNYAAFAAMKADGSITAWGNTKQGGSGAPITAGFLTIQSTQISSPYYMPNKIKNFTFLTNNDCSFKADSKGDDLFYAIKSGILPSGLKLDQRTGTISGTTAESGDFYFIINATNTEGMASISLSARFESPTKIDLNQEIIQTYGSKTDNKVKASGFPTPFYFDIIGAQNEGISIDNSSGIITVSNFTKAGKYTLLIEAYNGIGKSDIKPVSITVNRSILSITETNYNSVYGNSLPYFSTNLKGLVNGDDYSTIIGLGVTTTATAGSAVGTYTLRPTGANSNYEITLIDGTLNITKAALSILADNKTKVYGSTLPTFTTTVSGLVNGDTASAISGLGVTTTATASSGVGNYSLKPTGTNANYDITLIDGNLAVTKAALSILADNKSKVYGSALPTFTTTVSGLVNGDTNLAISGLGVTTIATASSGVGNYSLKPTGTNANYDITLVDGNLAVTKAALSILADNKFKVYGAALPTFTTTVSGLVNGDTKSALTGLGVTTQASRSSSVGTYNLFPTGTNPNYDITRIDGSLVVTKAALSILADNKAKVYGAALPLFTTSLAGLVNGDTEEAITNLGVTTPASTSSFVGNYTLRPTGSNTNYDITYVDGNLDVTKASLIIKAENQSYIRGLQAYPVFTYTISGFVNGDNANSLNGSPELSSTAKEFSPFGNYPITVDVSKIGSNNYNLSGTNGVLSINKVATSIIPVESIPILTTTNGAANGITIWGAGGKKLGTLDPYPGYTGRIVTAVGDLNGDGVVDIITGVGAGTSPLLRRFDGRTLKEIAQGFYAYDKAFMGGMSVAAADVDGDGLCEIITGTGNGSAPHVKVRKIDGTITASFYAYAPEFTRGVNLITGDIDGDSKAEIVSTPNWGGGPHVKVFDGKGKASASFFAYESTFIGGFSLALADTDGNGTKEIVTESYAGRVTSGRVFDPKGKMLREWFPHGTISSGGMVIAADLNGDKIDEIVSVALPGSPSVLKVFDGGLKQTASTLPYGASYTNGISIKAVDLNADGIKEIVTAPRSGLVPQVRRFDGTLKVLDSLFATATSFTGGIWLD